MSSLEEEQEQNADAARKKTYEPNFAWDVHSVKIIHSLNWNT